PGGCGGGLANSLVGTLTLNHSTISGNSSYGGGGICNSGAVFITNSTVSGNTVTVRNGGGGLYNVYGTLTLTNSTVSGNTVNGTVNSRGGAIENWGTLTLTNSTISGNAANGGFTFGGVYNYDGVGHVSIRNTIIANNTGASPDVYGRFNSQDYNLIGNTTGATFTGTT